jgi:predicted nucleotide-binding protein
MAKITLTRPKAELERKLFERAEVATTLLAAPRDTPEQISRFRAEYFAWDDYNATLLETSFTTTGILTSSPVDDYRGVGLGVLDLRLTRHIPADRIPQVVEDIKEKTLVLIAITERLDLYPEATQDTSTASEGVELEKEEAIFLVHGRNLVVREEVRRFLERVTEQRVIVLDEQANKGQDILGKLLAHAVRATFAVVLLTGDDEGRLAGEGTWLPRARQNVIMELGLFVGLLGRDKVAAIYEQKVEIPSDFLGVAYISLADWHLRLAEELKAAGIGVDLNRALAT